MELREETSSAKKAIEIHMDAEQILTYAAVHNGAQIIKDICIQNYLEEAVTGLLVKVKSTNELFENCSIGVEKMEAEETIHLKDLNIRINAANLASLTERSSGQIKVELYQGEKLMDSCAENLTILAFDQWPGLQYTPELLASFAMPNHPAVISMIQLAANYLKEWTKDPSLAGYQFGDPNRVKQMAAAVYAAIQKKNIVYAEPPSSFEEFGQRIRLADQILDQHLGTCMDLTLLYVSCLEAMGLNPIMILMNGHIFAGVWMIEESFSDLLMDDPSQLEKRMSRGIYEITVVECTALCSGKNLSFDDAVALAEKEVNDYSNFAFVIDVKRARSMGIRPLPVCVKTAKGFEVQHEERAEKEITKSSKSQVEIYDLPDEFKKEKVTKLSQWERKLLDLSLRNMLINMRFTKAVVPLLSSDVCILEDALADGEEFRVKPRPKEMKIEVEGGINLDDLANLGPFEEFIALESKHRKLYSLYTESELNKCLTKVYRSAKTSMEENGASTLYLAMGMLRWFEDKKCTDARYAPIVLIPIDIIKKSASAGYVMRMRDEDAQINITLLEFLKQTFDVQMNGLNPPPTDEHGLDIPKIFAIIRHAVMNFPMWDVVEVGFIGNFSFSQFVMWNDIHSNTEFLEKNKIVRSLMKGAVDWDCTECINEEDRVQLPVTVDDSQLKAIRLIDSDASFVLHGPPGTGKSQTITAMIANALLKGKRVLFVAEKMAALEVVQRRLDKLGIKDFCMELHSNKATKKAVLDQLKQSLEIMKSDSVKNYDMKLQEIERIKGELDAYVQALHKVRPFGKSIRQLIDSYEMTPEQAKTVQFEASFVGSLTEKDLEHQLQKLGNLIAAGTAIGHPHNHPLRQIHKQEYSQQMKFGLDSLLKEYEEVLKNLQAAAEPFVSLLGMRRPGTESDWETVGKCAYCLSDLDSIPTFLRKTDNVDREFSDAENYLLKKQIFDTKKAGFLKDWNENFLRMEVSYYRDKYEQANRKFFGKGKAIQALVTELQAFASFQVVAESIPVYLADLIAYQQDEKEVELAKSNLTFEWNQIIEEHPGEEALKEYKEDVKQKLQGLSEFEDEMKELKENEKLDVCIKLAEELMEKIRTFQEQEKKVQDLLCLEFESEEVCWIDSRLKACEEILTHASGIKDWIVYQQFVKDCRDMGLAPICDAYEEGLDHDEVMSVYKRSIYRDIILYIIEEEPVLNGFTGAGFNEKIQQFKRLDEECMELSKEELYYRLAERLPEVGDSVDISKELNILRRAITSNGRGISVRGLFEKIPNILYRMCPCMLMSPISVAQYLQPENDLFDIVIFDEASQLPTCKAVGVLARAENAVVVGDPNQMPPTSFFAGNKIDEDNLDIEELESVLDDCLALGMPSAYLRWHYRSRHESLITFSNEEFYESAMLTFPSVNDREKKVNLRKVDGVFERGKGRVNRAEAKAIVEEIKKRYRDPQCKDESVGVVTFNITQQTLIEDLLQEEYQKDVDFDRWANNGEEELFVKNLENVQGDERDVILFSIAYGPDEEGKVSMNFGPLNRDGGWKRLNVAVSRARVEMVVFTSITADMINLRRTKAKGVEALKDFLDYAQKGREHFDVIETKAKFNQGIMKQICEVIEETGYTYQRNVGHSRFKMDIGVVNPYNEEEYLLGIMLDGENYRQSGNTRDREVAQFKVLRGLGWDLHRIWAMDWWDNKEKEITHLMEHLEANKEQAYEQSLQREEESDMLEYGEPEKEPTTLEYEEPEEMPAALEYEELEEPTMLEYEPQQEKAPAAELVMTQEKPESFKASLLLQESSEEEPFYDVVLTEPVDYTLTDYQFADVEAENLSTADYVKKENLEKITEVMQAILDAEAPILYDRLVKKTLRAFHIGRSSAQTLEATDKAVNKIHAKMNKQAGAKFYWRPDQQYDDYRVYRVDANTQDRRSAEEICQQELKNAVCYTLREQGPLGKDELVKATIYNMGYSRSGAALIAAVDRGIKYGRKTGEVMQNQNKEYVLGS